MERGHRQAADQQLAAAVLGFVHQFRLGHHLPDRRYQESHLPFHSSTGAANSEDAADADAGAGHPSAVSRRRKTSLSGDDEALQRAGRQSIGLPRPLRRPDARPDRPVHRYQEHHRRHAGRPGRAGLGHLQLAAGGPVGAGGPGVPLARSGREGLQLHTPGPVRGYDVGAAEDVHGGQQRPAAAEHSAHDALDDASLLRGHQHYVLQRGGALLGGVQHNRHYHAVSYFRLGRSTPWKPAAGDDAGSGKAASQRGVATRWKRRV